MRLFPLTVLLAVAIPISPHSGAEERGTAKTAAVRLVVKELLSNERATEFRDPNRKRDLVIFRTTLQHPGWSHQFDFFTTKAAAQHPLPMVWMVVARETGKQESKPRLCKTLVVEQAPPHSVSVISGTDLPVFYTGFRGSIHHYSLLKTGELEERYFEVNHGVKPGWPDRPGKGFTADDPVWKDLNRKDNKAAFFSKMETNRLSRLSADPAAAWTEFEGPFNLDTLIELGSKK